MSMKSPINDNFINLKIIIIINKYIYINNKIKIIIIIFFKKNKSKEQ